MNNPEKQATKGTQDEENQTKTQHDMCWTPLYTNNVNKKRALLKTIGGKDEPSIIFMWKS
jgi:hypothetical protein